jgi:hypothetical protein
VRSLVVYSGERLRNVFSWGDLFNPNDGGWSDSTISQIRVPIPKPTKPNSNEMVLFDDWDYALIVRKGPFLDYDRAYAASLGQTVFRPSRQVVYPGSPSDPYGPNYPANFSSPTGTANGYMEEIRDVDLYEGIGTTFSGGARYMEDGSIIVGNIENRRGNPPNSSVTEYYSENNILYDYGPTTNYPIIDEVQPFDSGVYVGQSPTNNRGVAGLSSNIAEDETYYDGTISGSSLKGRARCPEIVKNAYYVYTAYPYIMLPDPLIVGVQSNRDYPKYPRYRPESGDIPDSYSYILKIEKFAGSSEILCGASTGSSNWIVGTDVGLFYSLNHGRDVSMTDIRGKVSAVFYTSSGIALAAVVLNSGEIQVVSSTASRSAGREIGQKWNAVTGLQSIFFSAGVRRVYNFEEYNSNIYISTNAGIIIGSLSASDWYLYGSVGDIASLSNKRALAQGFEIR